ncbi:MULTISPECIES: FAD-binding oxidoreductase [unclassified Nitratiruptor]|uniref:FAD-binding oxidoreductase n=1 Tax=unclassified Nitratiruptor TaxID=2624044 RepID=UPI001915163D|nr:MULTISPECIES: FAD-binding oxidoreductase [unclassified Nitratiruptor]BCD59352.1 CDP-4-dehydro-6-deoxyglucose reductase, E3 [Nitratiruptor sp. YY08-10]BCD63276.1 CDP-4-dehydro-6-deoxyglucose reductase, E3 [Nitratiruptor sp. YY08-14]
MPDPRFLKPWHGIPREEIDWHPTVDHDRCIGCATCVTGCNRLVYRYDFENEKSIVYDPLNCLVGCTTCHNTCPVDAISFPPFDVVLDLEKRVDEHHAVEDDLFTRRDILEYKDAKPAPKEQAKIVDKEIRGDVTILRCDLGNVQNIRAGRYIELEIPGKNWLGRSYSVANVPFSDGYVEFHIKKVPGGRFSEYAYNDLKREESLIAKGPYGKFVCDSQNRLYFVALGVGLAPLIGMIREVLLKDQDRDIKLFWGVSRSKDFYYLDEINELAQTYKNFKPILVAKEYDVAFKLPKHGQFFKKRALEAFLEEIFDTDRDYYIAGPFGALNTFKKVLMKNGVDESKIHTEI